MVNGRLLLIITLWVLGWMTPRTVIAQDFSVENFTADFYLQKEGYFNVVEHYDVDFSQPKHGLFRDFITNFDFEDEAGKITKREIYITDIAVPGRPFETGGIMAKLFGDHLRIKIGDKNKYVTAKQHYEIRYRVNNALIFTNDQVMFYWNVKPDGWSAVFQKVAITIHGPEGSILSKDNCFIYSGVAGNGEPSSDFDYNFHGPDFSSTAKDGFISSPGQSITALVKLPRSFINEVNYTPPFWQRHSMAGGVIILLGLFVGWIYVRIKRSRVTPVTSYYPPDNMDPAMAGLLIDNLTNVRDISGLLPYWASKGILRMEVIEKGDRSVLGDLKLIKLKELPDDAPGYSYNLFQKIFMGQKQEVLASSLRGIFGEPMVLLSQKSKQYYAPGQKRLIGIIALLSMIWAFFSIIFLPFMLKGKVNIDGGAFIAFIIVNFMVFFLIFPLVLLYVNKRYRVKTSVGKALTAELLGFREFIKKAELARIKELLNKDPNYFEKTMPFAAAFGLLDSWSSKFEQIGSTAPGWYGSTTRVNYNMMNFASSFKHSMGIARTAMMVSPSSGGSSHSGGGSSGGGAGGGGGGSW